MIVVLKVSAALLFIVLGWSYINRANYTPFIPPNTGVTGEFGFSGVLRGAGKVFFAFIGFDAVSTAAQEARKPQKDMPMGIVGSLAVCTIIYIVFSYVLTGIVNYKDLNVAAPVAVAIDRTSYMWMRPVIKFAIILGFTSVILVMLLGQSRVFFSMSRDGLLPKVFSDVHPKFRTPWRSNLLFMVFTGVFAAFAPISALGDMTSIGTLFAFVLVCIGIIVMRRTHAGTASPLQDAVRAGGAHPGNRVQSVPDVWPGLDQLGEAVRLDGTRIDRLLHVQPQAQLGPIELAMRAVEAGYANRWPAPRRSLV